MKVYTPDQLYIAPKDRHDDTGRICFSCDVYKTWDKFDRSSTGINGYSPHCKICRRTQKQRYKQEAMDHYGGACVCCGEVALDFLNIDHVAEDGAAHRRELGKGRRGGLGLYLWLRRNNFPEGFQVLCWNCNSAKHFGNGTCEPHGKYLGKLRFVSKSYVISRGVAVRGNLVVMSEHPITEAPLSDETPTIHLALNRVKKAVGAVRKGERNSAQNFNFRGVDAVVNACAGALNEHGVIVCPEVIEHVYETVEVGRNNTKMGHVTLAVKYTFYGPAGDSVSSTVLAESMDSGDKACAKAMSVAYRIALLQTLNLPTDEPDPDSQSYDRSNGELAGAKVTQNITVPKGVKSDWVAEIMNAATSKQLNDIWKNAGKAGDLQGEIMLPSGEKMTVQQLLYKRGDQLGFRGSAKDTETVSG